MEDKHLSNKPYSEFIALSRYARWLPEQNRRESWRETVMRYISFWAGRGVLNPHEQERLFAAILNMEVMPSMRALMTAGPALDESNVAGFNCSYVAVEKLTDFDEILYVLMCGTGVGFSCERQYISKLPTVPDAMRVTATVIDVEDSKIGWAQGFRALVASLYAGLVPTWDVSKVRPAGAPLKTFGGRASGPEPLVSLFKFTVDLFKKATGRKLNSIEVHGLVCKIAEIVVCGGVRRSALISLSNLSDNRMRHAKSGQWWVEHPEYALANNSVSYTEKPDGESFMREWLALVESKSGERGIFNRVAAQVKAAENGRREPAEFGSNPCSEIILRSKQFCNLTEVIARSDDTVDALIEKVRVAAILGTLQATLTDFAYLSPEWEANTKEEALLGVSITGIMDNAMLSATGSKALPDLLRMLKQVAIDTNKEWAERLGINQAAAITCVKPSGTVSQLVDSASGIHPRYAPYYIRTVRADIKDPLARMMKEAGVPCEPDVMKPDSTLVFSFPMKAPEHAVFRDDRTAIEQLELWLLYQRHWCEHKPSVTIYVKDSEWMEVGAWVYKHFNEVSGVSFLPHSDHTYQQAPYQECTKAEYEALTAAMPDIDWDLLSTYELEDRTTSAKTMACMGGVCEVVDLT